MKGIRLSDEQKDEALRLYQLGDTYEEIESKTAVSKASCSQLVADRSRVDPDLVLVHELAAWCKQHRRAPETLLRGIAVEDKLEEAGASVDDVTDTVYPYVKKFGSKAVENAENGEAYARLVESMGGLTSQELSIEISKRKRISDDLKARIEEDTALDLALRKEIEKKQVELGDLENLESICKSVRRMRRQPSDVSKVVSQSEELLSLGLGYGTLKKVGEEFKRRGMDPDKAPAEIAEAVKHYGTLDNAVVAESRAVREIVRRKERLLDRVADLMSRKKGLAGSCKDLSGKLNGLRHEYNTLGGKLRKREAASEQQQAQDKTRTENWCQQRIREAEAKATCTVTEATRRAERIRSEAAAQVLAAERRRDDANELAEIYESNARRKASQISGAEALLAFVTQRKQIRFREIQGLYGRQGPFWEQPLPDDVRKLFADSVEEILTADALLRLRRVDEESRRIEETGRQTLKASFMAMAKIEHRANGVLRLQSAIVQTGRVLDKLMDKVLSDPVLFSEALRRAGDGFMVDAFARVPITDRMRLKRDIAEADRKANEEIDRRFEKFMNVQMVGLVRDYFHPVPQVPSLPTFVPPGYKVLVRPVIKDGRVQYDQFGRVRYEQRMVPVQSNPSVTRAP